MWTFAWTFSGCVDFCLDLLLCMDFCLDFFFVVSMFQRTFFLTLEIVYFIFDFYFSLVLGPIPTS